MEQTTQSYKEAATRHGELKVQIRSLQAYLEKERPDVAARTARPWADDLTERLLDFQNSLFHHFRSEERSGIMENITQRFPEARPAIRTLIIEHDRILQDLNGVLSAVMSYSLGEVPANPHIRSWTRSLLIRLDMHETEETELLQKLIYEELGVGD